MICYVYDGVTSRQGSQCATGFFGFFRQPEAHLQARRTLISSIGIIALLRCARTLKNTPVCDEDRRKKEAPVKDGGFSSVCFGRLIYLLRLIAKPIKPRPLIRASRLDGSGTAV